jgi:LCP family protein required for cell wall assembly
LGAFWVRGFVNARAEATKEAGVSAAQEATEPFVPTPQGPLQRETDPTPVPWDGNSRATILVMGMDLRDWEDGTDVPRTDSMILVSVDPQKKTAGLLSIPRDMWVDIPEMGMNKINTAYRWGEVYKVPGGGPGLAMQTVQNFIDMPVQYYAMIDFNAFVAFIDEMGGLDMHIKEEIVVDPIGPGNTVTLMPGVQTLDGATALAYARTRDTVGDDFDRSSRQQEVIMAIRQQVLQFNMLPTLITKAPRLYRQVSAGISTNLTFDQIIRLALLASQIPEENIRKGVISPPLQVEISTNSADGQSILLPVQDQIRILRDEIFASRGVVVPSAAVTRVIPSEPPAEPTATEEVDLAEMVEREKARVALKNGTAIDGLASQTGEALAQLGINVVDETNADHEVSHTSIYVYAEKPYTLRLLREQLNVPESAVVFRITENPPADLEVVLGADWAESQP